MLAPLDFSEHLCQNVTPAPTPERNLKERRKPLVGGDASTPGGKKKLLATSSPGMLLLILQVIELAYKSNLALKVLNYRRVLLEMMLSEFPPGGGLCSAHHRLVVLISVCY